MRAFEDRRESGSVRETENGRNLPHETLTRRADEAARAGADSVQGDPFRLRYHFMPASGWMNDPNGLIQYRGEYHLFYQHYPYGDKWGPMHWGHAKSKDLVRWEHLPVALAPSEFYDLGDKDGYGCWSGSAVESDGKLVLFYTGHVDGRKPTEAQCMAASEDGVRFEKFAGNPVIADVPDEGERFGFRDPKVWRHGDRWYMVVGSGKNGRGQALLYKSAGLTDWEYVGVAAESDGTQGDMWECPDLFPLGGKHVLALSPMNMEGTKNLYLVGEMDYERGVFTPEAQGKLDDGFDFYAAQTFLDDKGRRILIGWMDMWGSKMIAENRGWYGAMTLPRELKLLPDGTLASVPVEELNALRGEELAYEELRLEDGRPRSWSRPAAMEWLAELDSDGTTAKELEIRLTGEPDEEDVTAIRYVFAERKLTVDRERSGMGDGGVSTSVLPPSAGDRIKLRLFADTSSIELFVNDGQRVVTNRIYPRTSSRSLVLEAVGGEVRFTNLKLWSLGDGRDGEEG